MYDTPRMHVYVPALLRPSSSDKVLSFYAPTQDYVLKYDCGEHLAVARWKVEQRQRKPILQPSFRMCQASNESGVPSLLRAASKIS